MQKIIPIIALVALTFIQAALVHADDCGPFQTQLSDGRCLDMNDESSKEASAGILLGLAAVGYGIYALTSSDDTPEEANLRAQEISDGYGLRLNNITAPIRISTMQPLSRNTFDQVQNNNEVKWSHKVNLLNVDYTW